jgi:hypothetical protein
VNPFPARFVEPESRFLRTKFTLFLLDSPSLAL